MNRYQLEVAQMDRRQRLVVRGLSFAGAGLLIVAALWSAGLPPSAWLKSAESWVARLRGEPLAPQSSSVPPAPPLSGAPVPSAVSDAPVPSLDGTDSSISTAPLPLYLLSTSPGRNFQDGTAQIGTSTTNPQTYVAGAVLANGATLAEIHGDFVVLKRGERSAKLSLYTLADNAASRAADDLLSVGGQQKPEVLVAATREVLTDYLRPSPLYDGEALRGYQVYPGQKSGLFAQLGLQPGDVITAINDAPFVDPAQAMEMFRQLTDGMAVTATIERKHRSERIALDGALITADQDRSRNAHVAPVPPAFPPPT
jgi:hypothetical protein